jgi:hypothetical protein
VKPDSGPATAAAPRGDVDAVGAEAVGGPLRGEPAAPADEPVRPAGRHAGRLLTLRRAAARPAPTRGSARERAVPARRPQPAVEARRAREAPTEPALHRKGSTHGSDSR